MTVFFASYGTTDTLDALQHARVYGTDEEYRDALAAHYAIVSPPAVTDDAAWHAVMSSEPPTSPVPTTGPTTSEPGGEGGEQPEDHAARIVSRLAPYVSTTWQSAAYTSPLPATPAAVASRVPARQDSGSPWHAKQAWAQSEARRRGLAHEGGAL